jgi:hypothetical protein
MAKPKRGRPIDREWVTVAIAAKAIGISPYALGKLRQYLKAGTHYRLINPQATTAKGRRYLYHPDHIADYYANPTDIPF